MATITYTWTREVYNEKTDEYDEIKMETDLEIEISVSRGRYSGPIEDSYPDEWDVEIVGGLDEMTTEEIGRAEKWLLDQDFEEILNEQKCAHNDFLYDSFRDSQYE